LLVQGVLGQEHRHDLVAALADLVADGREIEVEAEVPEGVQPDLACWSTESTDIPSTSKITAFGIDGSPTGRSRNVLDRCRRFPCRGHVIAGMGAQEAERVGKRRHRMQALFLAEDAATVRYRCERCQQARASLAGITKAAGCLASGRGDCSAIPVP
jgi:hypothetical protein